CERDALPTELRPRAYRQQAFQAPSNLQAAFSADFPAFPSVRLRSLARNNGPAFPITHTLSPRRRGRGFFPALHLLPNNGWQRRRLLRTIVLRPLDENLGNRLPKLLARNVVHLVVNPRPNSRIAGFLPNGANEFGVRREQVGEDLGPGGRERRVVRRVTREVRNWEQRYDRRIELMRPDVPV